MANLPSNTFLCNYNARFYDPATYTFPKTQGQLYDQDLVLTGFYGGGSITAHTDSGYVTINDYHMSVDFGSPELNPFNRYDDTTGRTLTVIYKTSNDWGGTADNTLFAIRHNDINYMIRVEHFHDVGRHLMEFYPSVSPNVMYVRVNADGSAIRKCVTTGQYAETEYVDYGGADPTVAFMSGSYNAYGENFNGDFYWLYISNEALTDAEIAQVIAYNENLSSFAASPTAITASYSGISTSVTLTTDSGISWTATTIPDWVTLSSTAGTDTTTITVNIMKNNSIIARTGSIVFTDENDDTAEVLCTQDNYPTLVPVGKLYREGQLID